MLLPPRPRSSARRAVVLIGGVALFVGSAAAIPLLMGDGASVGTSARDLADRLTSGSITARAGRLEPLTDVPPAQIARQEEIASRPAVYEELDTDGLVELMSPAEKATPSSGHSTSP